MNVTLRNAAAGDWLPVKTLVHGARRTMPALWPWEEHLADELFLVVERRRALEGAFLAWPDDSAVAWVRLAALEDSLDLRMWFELVLPPSVERLARRGARTLAWIDYRGWAGPRLPERGFALQTEVVTLIKVNDELPHRQTAGVLLRTASEADIPAVVAVDRAAFPPLWWNNEDTLRRRSAVTACFIVAEDDGQIVGYVEAEQQPYAAHINRIAVAPACQRHGIGAALLERALLTVWRAGADQVSLNTQSDNRASLRLYRRFGFEPTGDRVGVWERPLKP